MGDTEGSGECVKANRKDNDGAVDDLLDIGVDAEEVQNVADDAKHDRADDGAPCRACAAGKADAADDGGRNGLALIALRASGDAAVGAGGIQDARQTDEQARKRIGKDDVLFEVDAAGARRLTAAAESIELSSDDRLIQQHPQDDRCDQHDDDGDGNDVKHKTLAERLPVRPGLRDH